MNGLPRYQPDLFETYGRKLKIEYLGMASVYTIIALYFFGGLPSLSQSIIAAIGSFFLFLGLQRHIMAAGFCLYCNLPDPSMV